MRDTNKKAGEECTTSRYRGVTKHRRSGRWESHIWVAEKGKQVYLGGYELEEHAASAYDVAGLKVKGQKAKTNFDASKYQDLMQYLDQISFDDLVYAVRRQSQGFAKGQSTFKGVTKHPSGKWEARLYVNGSKHIYLGVFDDEVSAARAYDKAMIDMKLPNQSPNGPPLSTNFPLHDYGITTTTSNNLLPENMRRMLGTPSGLDNFSRGSMQQNTAGLKNAYVATGSKQNPRTLSSTLASMIQQHQHQHPLMLQQQLQQQQLDQMELQRRQQQFLQQQQQQQQQSASFRQHFNQIANLQNSQLQVPQSQNSSAQTLESAHIKYEH